MQIQEKIQKVLQKNKNKISKKNYISKSKFTNFSFRAKNNQIVLKEADLIKQKEEEERVNLLRLQFFNQLFIRVNKHLIDQTLEFRKLHSKQKYVIQFPQMPYKHPVQFQQPIPINPVPSPPVKPLERKRKRGQLSQWVYDTFKFRPREYKHIKTYSEEKKQKRLTQISQQHSPFRQRVKNHQNKLRQIKHKFNRSIKKTIENLSYLDYPITKIVKDKMFRKKPYEREKSRQFFAAIKEHDYQHVQSMLKTDPYHVYDKDQVHQNDQNQMRPIHWVSKLGYWNILSLLIQFKTLINVQDKFGRTPIYIATRQGHKKIIQQLMIENARVDIPNYQKRLPRDVAPSYYIRFLVEKLEQVRRQCQLSNESKQQYRIKIKRAVKFYFNS